MSAGAVARYASRAPVDCLAGFILEAVRAAQEGDDVAAVLARAHEAAGLMAHDGRAAVVLEHIDTPEWVTACGELAEHYLDEKAQALADEDRDPVRGAAKRRTIAAAFVRGAIGSEIAAVRDLDWPKLAARLMTPTRWEGEKVRAPAWLPVRLTEGAPMVRKDVHVAGVSCIVLDLDEGAQLHTVAAAVRALGFEAVLHTTWSHTPEHHKARVVFPLAEDCPRDQWLEVWRCAERWAAEWGAIIDPACKNPSRLYFLPALPGGEEWEIARINFRAYRFCGRLLPWRWLQATHQPPKPVAAPVAPPAVAEWNGPTGRKLDRIEQGAKRYARAAVEGMCSDLVAGGEGGRNNACFVGGRRLCGFVRAGAFNEGEGVSMLLSAAITAGLTEKEARTAITRGLVAGQGDELWVYSTTL